VVAPSVAIECNGIGLIYPSKVGSPIVALEDVSCRFEPGKVTAIIGPSGCGKSTLLLIVRGLLAANSGKLNFVDIVNGKPASFPPRMATVWQAFNLFPWRTVLDNVAFGLEAAGLSRSERETRARSVLAKVDLLGFEDRYPRQLSGGMRQRVGLARALVMEPEVLLLDEPFGALDAQTRLVLQEQLAEIVETTGTTALLVTHSIEEAILLADTVLVMTARPGRIADVISVELSRPRSLATTHDPEYPKLFDRVYEQLRDEVLRAMATESGKT
jgi:NitT/TauT family transport system ATP-binding protein